MTFRSKEERAAARINAAAFVERLKRLDYVGLSESDLALWLGRPRPTIHTWLFEGRLPSDPLIVAEMERRLNLLELSSAFPVPYTVRRSQRKQWIRSAYDRANGVPDRDPAREGAVL